MTDLQEALKYLRQRVNVTTRYPFDGNQLVIMYDDHRWLLNVLFKIQKDNLLPYAPKLVFFDSHDDYAGTRKQSQLLKSLGVGNLLDATEKDFSAFVDYEIGTDDGNWLSVACELNLISDAVVIGNKFGTNILSEEDVVHKSEDGTEHHLYKLSSDLDYELGGRGSLGDTFREDDFQGVRQFFDIKYGHDYAHIGKISPFILDFDLDFFTLNTDEGIIAWPLSIWKKHYGQFSMERRFIEDLMKKAEVITICREPDYCGNPGIGGANYNLQNLDRFFLNGDLGTFLGY
jgi:hypothetical protein